VPLPPWYLDDPLMIYKLVEKSHDFPLKPNQFIAMRPIPNGGLVAHEGGIISVKNCFLQSMDF
jgi:hypothetical protein